NRPNVKVAARRGYTSGRAIDVPSPSLSGDGPAEGAFGLLNKIPTDADLYAAGVVVADGLIVAAEIPSRFSTDWTGGGEVTVTVATMAGDKLPPAKGTIEPGTRATHVKVPLADTKSGPWRVQVAIKGEPGTLQNLLEVSASKGALVGDPLVYRGAPGGRTVI